MCEGKPFDDVFRNIRILVQEPDKHPQWQLHNWFQRASQRTEPLMNHSQIPQTSVDCFDRQ